MQYDPIQGTSQTDRRGAKQGSLFAPVLHSCTEWRVLAAHCSEGSGLEQATVITAAQTVPPFLVKKRKEGKLSPNSHCLQEWERSAKSAAQI